MCLSVGQSRCRMDRSATHAHPQVFVCDGGIWKSHLCHCRKRFTVQRVSRHGHVLWHRVSSAHQPSGCVLFSYWKHWCVFTVLNTLLYLPFLEKWNGVKQKSCPWKSTDTVWSLRTGWCTVSEAKQTTSKIAMPEHLYMEPKSDFLIALTFLGIIIFLSPC